MTTQSEQPLDHQAPIFWQPEVIIAFTKLCQSEGLNVVRMRRLVDNYIATKRKPSRQDLIDALRHRPRIQERATVLSSVTKKLNLFIESFT